MKPHYGFVIIALMCLASAAPSRAAVFDSLKITDANGNVVVNFSATDESTQFFSALQVGSFPPNTFKAGTLFFTEPKGETDSILTTLDNPPVDVTSKNASDALSINGSLLTGKFNVFFISDGASAAQAMMFPIFATQSTTDEVAGNMDVSATFGFPAGSIIVTSDVPEPPTWALMLIGVSGVALALYRRKHESVTAGTV